MSTTHGPCEKALDEKGNPLPYLYKIEYLDMDWGKAKEWFRMNPYKDRPQRSWQRGFGCSSVRKGSLYGRNFDFFLDESVDFIVHTTGSEKRFSSVGIASCNSKWTREYVKNNNMNEHDYAILPFALIDGINEHGVVCNVNVAPARDFYVSQDEWNQRVIDINPDASSIELYYQFMVRFVLDNAESAKDAVEKLSRQHIVNYVDGVREDYDGVEDGGDELHLMIADIKETYIVEIVPDGDGGNQLLVLSDNGQNGAEFVPIMTNFYRTLKDFDKFEKSPCGEGIERFNLLKSILPYVDDSDVSTMQAMMQRVKFSECYATNRIFSETWFSDLSHGAFNYNSDKAIDYFNANPEERVKLDGYLSFMTGIIESKDRSKKEKQQTPWITVHTNVFDIEKKEMHLWVQEDYVNKVGVFSAITNATEDAK